MCLFTMDQLEQNDISPGTIDVHKNIIKKGSEVRNLQLVNIVPIQLLKR
jgi:hypothetical protein